ncbi:NADH:ubiquinone oxidoreductase [Tulasnella sp. 427]|nr:NADH:ubiquinone oxidoreductase [Tulasnella sp. 427]
MTSIFDGEGDISVSEDDSRNIDWQQKYEQVKELLDLARDELDEFQASSQELEEELEKELQRTERAHRELEDQVRRLETDRDNWQAKFIQSNDLVNKLQLELTAVRQTISTYKSQVVELEMGNDDLERNERAAAESLKELETQFSRIMEEKILLEGEVGEKKTLTEENQRLKDVNSDISRPPERDRRLTAQNFAHANHYKRASGYELPNLNGCVKPCSTTGLGVEGPATFTAGIQPYIVHVIPPTSTPAESPAAAIVLDSHTLSSTAPFSFVGEASAVSWLNYGERYAEQDESTADQDRSRVPVSASLMGFGGKENQRLPQQPPQPPPPPRAPPRPRESLDSTRSFASSTSSKSPGWVVVQTEEDEENQPADSRKTPRASRVKTTSATVTTPTPLHTKAKALLRPRRSDSDTSRPEVPPFRLGAFGLGMRSSGSRASGRSSLSSASEAEFDGDRFGSVGKVARLSFASESDSDLDAILKVRDSVDTVKATPKAKPRSSVPARTLPREDSSILMPPPSSFPQRGISFKRPESPDVYSESPMSPNMENELKSSTGSVASSTSSKSSVKTKVVGAMNKYLHSSGSKPQVSGESKNEIKFPSRLGHKRSQSTIPAAPSTSQQPFPPSPSAIPAYTRRTSTDAIRAFTSSTPSINPPCSSVPLKYAGLPAAIPLEGGIRSVSSSSSVISPTNYYYPRDDEPRRASGAGLDG